MAGPIVIRDFAIAECPACGEAHTGLIAFKAPGQDITFDCPTMEQAAQPEPVDVDATTEVPNTEDFPVRPGTDGPALPEGEVDETAPPPQAEFVVETDADVTTTSTAGSEGTTVVLPDLTTPADGTGTN